MSARHRWRVGRDHILQCGPLRMTVNPHPIKPSPALIGTGDQKLLDFGGEAPIQYVLRVLWRRKLLILGAIALGVGLAILQISFMTPRYTAGTLVLIDPRKTSVVDVESVLSSLTPEQGAVESEVQLLMSSSIAMKVVERLGLYDDPEFNPALRAERPSLLSFLDPRRWLGEAWDSVLAVDPAMPSPEQQKRKERATVIQIFLGNVKVAVQGKSFVINVRFDSVDPEKAARIADTIADVYLVDQLEAKFEATRRATEWLESRLSGLRTQVAAAERAVESYRAANNLIRGNEFEIETQQLTEVNSQLIIARAESKAAEARLRQARELGRNTDSGSAGDVMSSPLIQNLRQQEAQVVRELGELSTRYAEKHPAVINKQAELRDLQAKIELEVQRIVRGLANALDVARTRERSLDEALANLKLRVASANQAEVRLRELEREADASKALLRTFLERFKETSDQEGIQQADARIIAAATVPTAPSWPPVRLIIAVALVLSAAVGVIIALIIEQLDNSYRGLEQVEQITGVTALGIIPTVRGRRADWPERTVVAEPMSAFSEAHRTLLTSLQLSNIDSPPRVIVVTSALPADGKTTLSVSLAQSAALSGLRTVVVEGDLRRSRIREIFGELSEGTDLVACLRGETTTISEVQLDASTRLAVIPATTGIANPGDLLASRHMETFVRNLAERYDLVVIDSPPLLAVSEARVLARLADKVVFAVRWGRTPRKSVALALRILQQARADLAGIVLTRVNVRRYAGYGYGDSGYHYSGRYRAYYPRS